MVNQISEDRAILAEIRRLRRFAITLTSDESAADDAVLAAISEKRDLLSSPRDFGRVYHALLRDIYQKLYDQSDRRRKLSLITPAKSQEIALSVKMQSLDIEARAIVSLHLIEKLSCGEITSILDQPLPHIMEVLERSLTVLTQCEDEAIRRRPSPTGFEAAS